MIAVICKRVERDTASGGSELGGSVRMRPVMLVDQNFYDKDRSTVRFDGGGKRVREPVACARVRLLTSAATGLGLTSICCFGLT
jgi:hypothetical protein